MLGAATGLLVSADASAPVAVGAVWMGLAGGGFPDWIDLRSELRGSLRLRHRGASHGVLFAFLATGVFLLALRALSQGIAELPDWAVIDSSTVVLWTAAFGGAMLSHLLADACTHAGIRPFLPISNHRLWLLPKLLRSRSDGYLDTFAMMTGVAVIGLIIVRWVALHLPIA